MHGVTYPRQSVRTEGARLGRDVPSGTSMPVDSMRTCLGPGSGGHLDLSMNRVVGSLPRPSRATEVGAKKSIDAVLHSPAYAQAGWRSIERGALQSFGRMPNSGPALFFWGRAERTLGNISRLYGRP